MTLPNDVRPAPGTHKDVFLYDRLQVAGIYYPNAGVDDETIFDSGFFFYDYYDMQDKFMLGMNDLVNNHGYKLKSRNPNKYDVSQITPYEVPPELMYDADKYIKLFESWITRFTKTRTAPNLTIIDRNNLGLSNRIGNIIYRKITQVRFQDPTADIIGGFDLLDITSPLLKETISTVTGRPKIKVAGISELDKTMGRHPLSHFPPLDYYNYLDDVVFFDPANPQLSMLKLQGDYGPNIGMSMFSEFQRRGKLITYGDIIKPFGSNGYGVQIDFRPFGFSSYSVQPWWEYYTWKSQYIEEIWNAYWPMESVKNGQKYRDFTITPIYSQETYLLKNVFEVRDSWIHFWLLGGRIPLEGEIDSLLWSMEKNLESRYPIYVKLADQHLVRQVAIKIASIIVTAIIAYYTGGSAMIIMTAITTMLAKVVPRFLQRFPISVDSQMAINMIFSMSLNQFATQEKGVKKNSAFEFMINNFLSDQERRALDQGEITAIKNAMSNYDDSTTDRQRLVLELLARHKDERLNGFMEENGSTAGFDLEGDVKAIDRKIVISREFGKESSILKFGAIALAAVAGYKLIK